MKAKLVELIPQNCQECPVLRLSRESDCERREHRRIRRDRGIRGARLASLLPSPRVLDGAEEKNLFVKRQFDHVRVSSPEW